MNGHSEKRSSVNDIIRICVGGQNFKTTRATLMSDENCMLAKMFENDETGKKISEIDRSKKCVSVILIYLQASQLHNDQFT